MTHAPHRLAGKVRPANDRMFPELRGMLTVMRLQTQMMLLQLQQGTLDGNRLWTGLVAIDACISQLSEQLEHGERGG